MPKNTVSAGVNASLITGGAGLFVSAIENSLAEHKRGATGVFTRGGKMIGLFGESFLGCRSR